MLIVDDEEIITDGLAVIFGKMELELDIYKAYSGREALNLLHRTRVDIVLSDICMPEMDGLELMEHIRRSWPQCKNRLPDRTQRLQLCLPGDSGSGRPVCAQE
ncbi:response regulator [Paenibacillus rhizoplanae]